MLAHRTSKKNNKKNGGIEMSKFYIYTIYIDEHISVNERIRSSTCDADMINEVDVYQTMEGEELK